MRVASSILSHLPPFCSSTPTSHLGWRHAVPEGWPSSPAYRPNDFLIQCTAAVNIWNVTCVHQFCKQRKTNTIYMVVAQLTCITCTSRLLDMLWAYRIQWFSRNRTVSPQTHGIQITNDTPLDWHIPVIPWNPEKNRAFEQQDLIRPNKSEV